MKLPFRMIIIKGGGEGEGGRERGREGGGEKKRGRERELFVNMEEGHEWPLKYRSIRLDTEWQGL